MSESTRVLNCAFSLLLLLFNVAVIRGVCFANSCSHQNLTDCVTGHYVCQQNEFCEVTSIYTSGASRVIMDCRPHDELPDCEALSLRSMASVCSPGRQQQEVCHWCCPDALCLRQLAHGVFPGTTTTPYPVVCEDVYLGNCAHDFSGRCREPLIQQLCAGTCGTCPGHTTTTKTSTPTTTPGRTLLYACNSNADCDPNTMECVDKGMGWKQCLLTVGNTCTITRECSTNMDCGTRHDDNNPKCRYTSGSVGCSASDILCRVGVCDVGDTCKIDLGLYCDSSNDQCKSTTHCVQVPNSTKMCRLTVLQSCNSDYDCDPNTMQCVDKGDGSRKCYYTVGNACAVSTECSTNMTCGTRHDDNSLKCRYTLGSVGCSTRDTWCVEGSVCPAGNTCKVELGSVCDHSNDQCKPTTQCEEVSPNTYQCRLTVQQSCISNADCALNMECVDKGDGNGKSCYFTVWKTCTITDQCSTNMNCGSRPDDNILKCRYTSGSAGCLTTHILCVEGAVCEINTCKIDLGSVCHSSNDPCKSTTQCVHVSPLADQCRLTVLQSCNSDADCDPNTMQCVDKGDGRKLCYLIVGNTCTITDQCSTNMICSTRHNDNNLKCRYTSGSVGCSASDTLCMEGAVCDAGNTCKLELGSVCDPNNDQCKSTTQCVQYGAGHQCGLTVLQSCNSNADCDPNTMQCVVKGQGSKKCYLTIGKTCTATDQCSTNMTCSTRHNDGNLKCRYTDYSPGCSANDAYCVGNAVCLFGKFCGLCEDAYGGDCATDFPGVCDVYYVQEVCVKTCGVCT